MKSEGLARDAFVWERKINNLLEGSQDLLTRPSDRSSTNSKRYGEGVRMVTVVTGNNSREVFRFSFLLKRIILFDYYILL